MSKTARVAVPAALLLGWVALWLATVPRGDFPLNDDWTYGFAVRSVVETGRLVMLPWSAVNAVAQVYWGALFCTLFGFSYETLRASTGVLGAVGVLAAYGLLREVGTGVAVAALGALVVGCNPLYLSQSVTFMTDVPFAALVIVSLWLYARGGRLGAYGVGLLAVLVRQFAVVLPAAFAIAAVRRRRLSVGLMAALAGSLLVFLGLHLGFQKWMVATHRTSGFESQVTAFLHVDLDAAGRRFRSSVLPALGLFGMCLLPFSIVEPDRFRRARLAWWAGTIALAAALLAALVVKQEIPPLPGNVLSVFGIGPLTLTDMYQRVRSLPVLPGAERFWTTVTVGACWGAAMAAMTMLAAALDLLRGEREGSRGQEQVAALLGFIAAYGGAIMAFVLIAPLFDRYLIPLLAPTVAIMAMAKRERLAIGIGAVLVAAMAVFSVSATHDWLAWHRSRWEAVRFLEARSIPATKIDGGYEFNGTTTYQPVRPEAGGKPGWWVVDNAYMLSAGPMEGFHEIASFPVAAWLWRDGERILVLQRD